MSARTSRFASLDALRAIAVILVLGRHLRLPIDGAPDWLAQALLYWQAIGWLGVDLFFVLSGFLVSGLLFTEHQRHGSTRVLRFLGRRGFKIYPAFYVVFAVGVIWSHAQLPLTAYLSEAFFVQNYGPRIWQHTWSLAVEEHFYLALALTVAIVQRWRPGPNPFRGLPLFCALICVAVFTWRSQHWFEHPSGYLLLKTHYCLDSLTFGVVLSYAWHYHHERTLAFITRFRPLLIGGGFLLLVPCLVLRLEDGTVVNTIGLTLNYLGFGAILLACLVGDPLAKPLWVRALAPIGFYSYSIYLWHMPLSHGVKTWVEPQVGRALGAAIYLSGALVLGVVLARLIEVPFLKLRDRWLPSRA